MTFISNKLTIKYFDKKKNLEPVSSFVNKLVN